MHAFEDDVLNQIEHFFEDIGIEYDEFGGGTGFFSASATIGDIDDINDD